ncbi:uncharacterized protein LOC112892422 [Panicum hallii]|uniref:uncharacterized protein LOC112892422 n=1 Tax=Panicum hallii TaxID=206008 RepID=UPI000DF4D031|nr:uncharacterized protein LOC112892422 [Panicum hallii]
MPGFAWAVGHLAVGWDRTGPWASNATARSVVFFESSSRPPPSCCSAPRRSQRALLLRAARSSPAPATSSSTRSGSTPRRRSDCGYPGLGLVSEDDGTLVLPVKSHRYRVFRIDYDTPTVVVSAADTDEHAPGCPRLRHMNLTIDTDSSWLRLTVSHSNDITSLYDCMKNASSLSSAVELSWCQEAVRGCIGSLSVR